MERFFYEDPSLERKEDIIEYFNEFVEYGSEIYGSGSLDKVLEGVPFEEVLDNYQKMTDEEYAKANDRCPGKTFLLIRENDNKMVGTLTIRWNLTGYVAEWGGHIGYSVRPTERNKGYNKINLYLGLIESEKLNIDKIMITCDRENLGSDKTIKALGGVLERSGEDPFDNTITNVYWIDVKDSIEKYKDVYGQCIISDKQNKKEL